MARKIRSKIETRSHRLTLPVQSKPHWTTVAPGGVGLGYRRNKKIGAWVVRVADDHNGYTTFGLGVAPDDYEPADGVHVLDFSQAVERARELARSKDGSGGGRPTTWRAALDAYENDLRSRGGDPGNARRVRNRLPPALLDKPVGLLTAPELRHWRDALLNQGLTAGAVSRITRAAKASLTAAAKLDTRIVKRPWVEALGGLRDTWKPVDRVIDDHAVCALVTGAYAHDPEFGLLVDTLAVTGSRLSQNLRLTVDDLQADGLAARLLVPASRKGRRKEPGRTPVPITAALAHALAAAAAGRARTAPLLVQRDGTPWPAHLVFKLFAEVAQSAGIAATTYNLRHSSIVRMLLRGVPLRLVASLHDTSSAMIERTYSSHISSHGDELARRALLNTKQPVRANVVPLPTRR
jgi:integrase